MPKTNNLLNKTFGDLTVISLYPKSDHYGRFWVCRCSCGQEIAVRGNNLVRGHTKSCGRPKEHRNRLYSKTHKEVMNS